LPEPEEPTTARVSPGHRPPVLVGEGHVVELDGRGRVGREGLGAVLDRRLGVDELENALGARAGLLPDGEDHGEHPYGSHELGEVRGERDEGAERDLAPYGEPAAQRQHRDLAEGGHGLEGRGVLGVEPDGPQPPREEPPSDVPELPGLLLLLPEALHHAYAADGAVDHTRHGGGLRLRVPGGGVQLGAAALGDDPEGGGDGERDQGEGQGERGHDPEGDQEEQHVPDGHREHEEQALDQLEVAGGAADDLAGGQLVLASSVEPGDRPVHLGPQVVLDVEGEAAAVVAADVGEDVHDDGGGYERARPGRHGLAVVPDDVVDDHLGDQRDDRQDRHAAERGAEREQDVLRVPPRVPREPLRPAALVPLLECHAGAFRRSHSAARHQR
jgi:hypothetical protein